MVQGSDNLQAKMLELERVILEDDFLKKGGDPRLLASIRQYLPGLTRSVMRRVDKSQHKLNDDLRDELKDTLYDALGIESFSHPVLARLGFKLLVIFDACQEDLEIPVWRR